MSKHGFFTKWIHLVIAAVIATPIALTAFGGGGVAQAATPVISVDDAGADDEPGQKDLNALSVNYGDPGATAIDVTWNWDDTANSGANTRDACSLFDTDGDGFANYALCLTVDASNVSTPSLYECTADSQADRCAGPTQLGGITSTLSATVGSGDPFGPGGSHATASHSSGNTCRDNPGCYTQDTIATVHVELADVGGGIAKLINVCSFPSREPNSDPSDCVFSPNNGFLTIVKTVDDPTTDQFVFNASAAASNLQSQWTITGAGTESTISYAPTTTLDLNEVIPAGWNLASKSCVIQTLAPTPTGTGTATGIDNFEIRSGLETICTFDNTKQQAGVTLQKVWVDGKAGDTAALTLSRPGVTANATSTAPDAPSAANSATVTVLAGQTVSLSEELGGAGANYDTSIACTGNSNAVAPAPGNRSATLLISAADAQASITCTFTNTRKGVNLTVSKVWQNAKVGDAVSITTTGAANNVNFPASAGAANETDTTATPYRVFAGETLTFAEQFTTGSAAAYTTTLDCTGAADTNEGDGLTIAPTDTAITCTYTNARRSVQVVVAKQLSPVNDAGRFDLSINNVTKVTNGGNGATSAASPVTAFVGDSVSVAEAASAGSPALANYTSSLACDNGIAPSPNTGTSGSFTVPTAMASGTTITCTFSNTRNQATFTLNKDWGNANSGEVVSLSASATGPAPIGSPIATQSTAPTDSGASMTVYSGQTITFSETFAVPANGSNYTSSVSCLDGQGNPVASGLTIDAGNRSGTLVVGSSPGNVTCTISNTLKQGGVIVQKVWVNGRAGDTAALSASIGAGTPVQDTSVAPSAPVINPGNETLDNVVAIPAFAGDTVNFSESLGGAAGLYTTAWSCTNQAATSGTGTSGSVTITPDDAGENPVVCTITNTRKTATVELTKGWGTSPSTADEVKLDIGPGGSLATANSAVDGTPNGTASVVVLVGDSYPFAESFTTGDAANYTSSWTCDAAADTNGSGLSGSVAVTAADAGTTVRCRFVNDRKVMTLKLQKAWVNGHAGDTAQLAIDGINDNGATSTATSTLGTVTDTTHVATVTAYAGETVTLNETVVPGANYNSSLACGAHAVTYSAGARTGSIAIAPADATTTVTCTYTNSRKSANLTVEKTWNDPVGGPTVTLAASGGLSAGLSGTTTSTSPTNLVTPTAPTMTIFAGETINVSETFANAVTAGMFNTTLSCATPSTAGAAVSGSIVLGSDPVNTVCTFDNVRKSTTLTLHKSWTNGAAGDNVVLSADGTGPIATNTAIVPNGGDGLSAATASLTVYAGEDVALSEMFDADNVGSYTISNFTCDDGTADAWSPGTDNNLVLSLTNGGDVADAISCTVSNVRKASTLTLAKVWVDPASGPAAVTLNAAGNDAYAADSDTIVSTSPTGQSITIDVLSGETVSVSEAFDTTGGKLGAANYNTTLLCTGGSLEPGVYQKSVVIGGSPSPITCTFTNTRKSTTLTLQKAWVKPVAGDQVTLAINGTNVDNSGAVVAPATTETASTTVYAGETVTVSELIAAGNTAIYDVDDIDCSAGTVGWSGLETDTDATVSVSAADIASPITCTITNSAQRGTIVVVKNTAGGNGTFDFDGTWAGGGDFQLTTSGGTASTTYTDVLVPKQGGYSVVETDPTPAFDGTNVTCTDADGGSGPAASASQPLTGSIDLDDDETVTCTFTNTKRATIVIIKDAQPDSAQDFPFTTTGLATQAFDLDDDGPAGSATSNMFTSELVPANGTYTVTEGSTFGWTLSPTSSCTSGGTIDGSTATIVPAPGATVTCTFVNTANPAGLTATKNVANQVGPWGPFTFVLSGGTFTGDAQQNVDSADATANWTNLVEGQIYTLVESGPVPGYTLGTFTCQIAIGGSPTTLPDADAQTPGFQFVGVAGAQYQCGITNTAISPTLVVNKTTVGGFGTFNFDVTPVGANPASPALLTATTSVGNNPASSGVSTLMAGEGYSVSEQAQAEWIPSALTCTVAHAGGGSQAYAFGTPTLAGDVITCSITNTKKATITVWKQTDPDLSQKVFGFEASWNGAFDTVADFTLTDGTSHGSGLLTPGVQYFVKELDTAGWTLTGVTCRGDATHNPAVVTPAPGENVVCVFSNSQLGDVVVDKVADPASIERDGTTYKVTYKLTVTNASQVDESYDLSDSPAFASGVTISSMLVNGPGVTDLELGADGGDIVTDGTIAARTGFDGNEPLEFTVVVTFTMAGNTADRACDGADSGTFNTATVVFDRGTNSDSDCVPLPAPAIEMTKTADPASATHVSGNRYEVSYTITATNTGEGAGSYTLSDTPDFGAGITIVSLSAESTDATVNPAFWTGGPVDKRVAIDQPIQADETDTFTITAIVDVAYNSVAGERTCNQQPGNGAFNTASLTSNGPATPDSSACVSLPLPQIAVDKTADMDVAEHVDGNTYKAEYTVTVTNNGDGPGHYDLADLPAFGAGANVINVTIDPAIVTDVNIDPHDAHEYTVTVTFTVAPAMPAAERECALEPTSGQGAYNGVTVTFNDGTDDDSACVDIPRPDISVTKVATTEVATHVSGNTYEAVYTVTVTNDGDGPGQYDLIDLPEFGEGATVTDIDPQFANDMNINAGETDEYTVTVTFTVDGSMTTEERECGEVLTPGQGAFNSVTVSFNDGGSDQDADCIDIPAPNASVTKSVTSATRDGSGLWTIVYDVVVSNTGDGVAALDVNDALQLGGGVTINTVVATTATPGVTPRVAFNGTTDTLIAPDVTVFSNSSRTFSVTVTARIDAPVPGQGACDPEGTEAGGFLNTVTLRSARTGDVIDSAFACAPFSTLTLVKNLVNNSGGTATIADFVLTAVANGVTHVQGTGTVTAAVPAGTYTLAETAKAGYASSGFSCSTGQTGSSVTVPVASAVTCTITNDDAPVADLAIVKTASVAQVGAGGGFTWLLNVTNNGPDPATNVSVSDIVPGQVTVTGVTSTQFSCSNSGNTVTCTKPTMAVGETGVIAIAVTVPSTAASGTVTNVGSVTATQPDSNLSNNSDDASVTIVAQAPPPPTPPPVILPPTGSNSTTPVTWAAISLVLLGGLVLLVSRRRRDHLSVD